MRGFFADFLLEKSNLLFTLPLAFALVRALEQKYESPIAYTFVYTMWPIARMRFTVRAALAAI
jgi:hypothetical protein